MDINLNTPALLFPAVSLLMLAYTNRFLALANLVRTLHSMYRTEPTERIATQISSLRYRIRLIRSMQALGVTSILLAVLCMFFLFEGWQLAGKIVFAASLIALIGSLLFSLREIQLSGNALEILLEDMEDHKPPPS
ncbi:MAG: DUF2721 domain-containing protein [Armatimonadaceae bacterium]